MPLDYPISVSLPISVHLMTSTGSDLSLWEKYPEDEIVVKANELVMGQLDWTVWEYRIFLAHVAQLRKDDTEFQLQRVRLRDVEQLSESTTKRLYELGEEVANRMTSKTVSVRSRGKSGKERYSSYNVYSSCHYENGVVEGRFTKEMKPLLLQLKDRGFFTMYRKKLALSMSSIYSVRFYEIIKRYEHEHGFRMTVEELRRVFNLEDKYDRFADLRKRVVDTAKREIEERCDITFEYEIERDGRTPVALVFRIRPNVKPPLIDAPVDEVNAEARPAPRHVAEDKKSDAIESYFESLSLDAQEVLRSQARAIARENNPNAGKAVTESETWTHIRRLIRERYLSPKGND